jgi:soluble lytic murein transglycosylase-like protein
MNASTQGQFDDLYQRYGSIYNIDWKLIKAIAIVESSENPNAVNPNDPSVGLMQVLCQGWPDSCTNTLYLDGWPPTDPKQLLDPEYNVKIGAGILADNIGKYGVRKGVAVYNSNKARYESEPFNNQSYLDKVMLKYGELTNG